jgi:hypothetical protein
MEREHIERMPSLARMLDFLSQVEKLPSIESYRASLTGLLGTLPEHADTISNQIEICDSVKTMLSQLPPSITTIYNTVNTEFNEILNHLNTTEWFEENLRIGKEVRYHWRMFEGHYTELLILLSTIDRVWRFPLACINAQHNEVLDAMLVGDYLYMVDVDSSIMENYYKNTDLSIQPRLKQQQVSNFHDMDFGISIMAQNSKYGVPAGQMALVACMNIFERFTAEVMIDSLTRIKTLLRPGGMIFFTVLDAMQDSTAMTMVEGSTSGVTKSQMHYICQQIGLELKSWKTVAARNGVSVVLRAPGELTSSKTEPSTAFRQKS